MYHFALLRNIILPPCFWGGTWNGVKPSPLCQERAFVVSWRKCTNWSYCVKISIYEHLVNTGRLEQLNSVNNPFVPKELLAPTVPQNDWLSWFLWGNTELEQFSWWHGAAVTMLGTRGMSALCPDTHLCAPRLQEAGNSHARAQRQQGRSDAAGAGEWGEAKRTDPGCGKETGGQKWMYHGTVSSPAARLYNFNLLTGYRNIKVVNMGLMRATSTSHASEYQQFLPAVLEILQLLNKLPLRQSDFPNACESETDLCQRTEELYPCKNIFILPFTSLVFSLME